MAVNRQHFLPLILNSKHWSEHMKQLISLIKVDTTGKGLFDITSRIDSWVRREGFKTGLLTIFIKHTSASLTIQENADPDVQTDLVNFYSRLVPEGSADYIHTAEGKDDMPAHIKCSLTDVQLSIPVMDGDMTLGTWQGIYLFEHRARAHTRTVVLHFSGE
jgi:secondary thiamine-phosphate synthase enzyme